MDAPRDESIDEMLHRMSPNVAYVKARLEADGVVTRYAVVMRDGTEMPLSEIFDGSTLHQEGEA